MPPHRDAPLKTPTSTPTTGSPVKVLKLQRVDGRGAVKAYVDVAIGPSLEVYGFRVMHQGDRQPWVSAPQRSYQAPDGSVQYVDIVKLTGPLKARVEAAILNAYAKGEAHG